MKINDQTQDMSCRRCINHVKLAIREIPGVEDADVQLNSPGVLLTELEPVAMGV